MNTITRIILRIWTSFVSIFGNAADESKRLEAGDLHRLIIVVFRIAGRDFHCEILPHRDENDGLQCALLCVDSPSLTPRVLRQVVKYVARDYFRKTPESLTWIYIPAGRVRNQ
jgi:hypothetical protein